MNPRQFPLQGQWWEVSTNGEYVGVRATLGTSTEIRELVAALEAYLPFMEERETKQPERLKVLVKREGAAWMP